MTRQEYDKRFNEMYTEYKKYDYRSDEARKLWKDFYDKMNECKRAYHEKEEKVVDRVYPTLGYKLSKAQEKVVRNLIKDMYTAKLGKEFMLNHYEIWRHEERTTEFIFSYYERGAYLERMNTKTLEKLESLGVFTVEKVGGTWSDTVIPNFDFELTEEERSF